MTPNRGNLYPDQARPEHERSLFLPMRTFTTSLARNGKKTGTLTGTIGGEPHQVPMKGWVLGTGSTGFLMAGGTSDECLLSQKQPFRMYVSGPS